MKKSMSELGRLSAEEYISAQKSPLVVVLDNIRSLHNVGSVFRTADSFRVSKVFLCGITATPPNKEIQKTALGATETVSWSYIANTADVVEKLKKENFIIIGVEQTYGSIDILNDEWIFEDEKIALVFGNEVFGISDDVLNLCDRIIEIPQFGTKHSLNVSVCAGIVIYEAHKMFVIQKNKI